MGLELFNGITYNGFAILWVDCRKTPMAMFFFQLRIEMPPSCIKGNDC